jgi:hypothetical protein
LRLATHNLNDATHLHYTRFVHTGIFLKVRFEVLEAVTMKITVFLHVPSCSPVRVYRRLGRTSYIHPQDGRESGRRKKTYGYMKKNGRHSRRERINKVGRMETVKPLGEPSLCGSKEIGDVTDLSDNWDVKRNGVRKQRLLGACFSRRYSSHRCLIET